MKCVDDFSLTAARWRCAVVCDDLTLTRQKEIFLNHVAILNVILMQDFDKSSVCRVELLGVLPWWFFLRKDG